MKVKEESEKVGLKLNIQKTKIMASSPITSWQIDGGTVETVADFIFLCCKIPADGDCSHEIKRCFFLRRKVMTNLDSILKSRDVTLPTKVCLVKAMVFQVVVWMWELDYKESCVPKNWCFWTVVLEKILESPLDFKEIKAVHPKGNQAWIFIGRTWCWSWNSNTLAPDATYWLIWKDPDAGNDWRREEKRADRVELWSPTQWTWVWVRSRSWYWAGKHGILLSVASQRVRHDWVTELNIIVIGRVLNH